MLDCCFEFAVDLIPRKRFTLVCVYGVGWGCYRCSMESKGAVAQTSLGTTKATSGEIITNTTIIVQHNKAMCLCVSLNQIHTHGKLLSH